VATVINMNNIVSFPDHQIARRDANRITIDGELVVRLPEAGEIFTSVFAAQLPHAPELTAHLCVSNLLSRLFVVIAPSPGTGPHVDQRARDLDAMFNGEDSTQDCWIEVGGVDHAVGDIDFFVADHRGGVPENLMPDVESARSALLRAAARVGRPPN
jgi:hypothetical protein